MKQTHHWIGGRLGSAGRTRDFQNPSLLMTYSPPDRSILNRRSLPMAVASLILLLLQASAQAQLLELAYTTQFTLAYKDSGGGGDYDGSFWEPKVPAGYKPLGQIASNDPHYRAPAGMAIVRLAGAGSALAYPVDFEGIWWDKGSGAEMYGLMWRPIPPPNYVSLGTVLGINNWDKPALTSVVCVRKDLTVEGTVGDWIYDDSGTGADQDGSAWKIVAPPGAIDLRAFIGQRPRPPLRLPPSPSPLPSPRWGRRARRAVSPPIPLRAPSAPPGIVRA